MKKICILTSGKSRGTNYQAIAAGIRSSNFPISIEFVGINNKRSPIIQSCEQNAHKTKFISTRVMEKYEEKVVSLIHENNIDLVVLAGFMKKLSQKFIGSLKIPILNIHPALLPKFGGKGMYGENVHKAVFEAGESISGATVHLVNEKYDEGNIVLQEEIDISNCSNYQEIGKKVLKIEHKIYFQAIIKMLFDK